MAERLRDAYKPLFTANEYAWKLNKPDLQVKLISLSGAAEGDNIIPSVTGTFLELSKLAKWDGALPKREQEGTGAGANGANGSNGAGQALDFCQTRGAI